MIENHAAKGRGIALEGAPAPAPATTASYRLTGNRLNLAKLRAADAQVRRPTDIATAEALLDYYNETATERTAAMLAALGMGVQTPSAAQQISILRYSTDRNTVIYANPPVRWLLDANGKRLAETNKDLQAMRKAFAASRMDVALRKAERLRYLGQVAYVRFYGHQGVTQVEPKVFYVSQVWRDPSEIMPTRLEMDNAFALRFSNNRFEIWFREEDKWHMAMVDGNGAMLPDQPFAATDLRNPYPSLPIVATYAGMFHEALPPLRNALVPAIEGINAAQNDQLAAIRASNHGLRVWLGVAARDVPTDRGHGIEAAVDEQNVDVRDLTNQPYLDSTGAELDRMIRRFLVMQGLPPDDFEGTELTGAAYKARMHGLVERRKDLLPLAAADERLFYKAYRGVHNVFAKSWGAKFIDAGRDLEVEVAPLDVPMDTREQMEVVARSLALGLDARPQAMMMRHTVGRDQAIAMLKQIDEDNKSFPVPASMAGAVQAQSGPKGAIAADAAQDGADSVVDNAKKASQPEDE